MVDIHTHILPALDDGARSLDESVQMAEMAIADGTTHLVATPHANGEYPFNPERIAALCRELQNKVGDRLKLATGCDFHLSYENLQDIPTNTSKYTINQKKYLLVEFADFSIPPSADDTLHRLHLMGLSPIITHPERNRLIRSQPERLRRWLHQGCYVQITAQSLLGKWGEGTKKQVEEWLDLDIVHFSRAMRTIPGTRPPLLGEAYKVVAERRGAAVAKALFEENPLAAFEGRPLPYEPEQPEVTARTKPAGRRKRFIFF